MPSVAPVKRWHRNTSATLAAGGLAVVLALLVTAVVAVSDDSTRPTGPKPTAFSPTPSPSRTAPAPTTATAAPTATAPPPVSGPTQTAATEVTAPPNEPGQEDGPPWRRHWRYPRLHPGGQ